eukprot:TRINITY_DN56264_c0_g1_i1.p1 TRINITY_DN56264_c0_g1~~TRINITY_DN56264_c0_g1_i1.p1  ORF type:complete len:212 (+),score=74.85 TRINITY_DN56264_c0_g1_i1:67-636(+)
MASRAAQPALRKAPSKEDATAAPAPALRKAASSEAVGAAAAPAAPAMKAMKAGPARMTMVMKAAPKKKAALPMRGGPAAKKGAKPKAIAAKEFAGVAAKLKKSKSKETVAGSGQWYFMSDLRKLKVGVDDSKAWTKYDAKMNKQLEMAYSKGFKQYTMKFKDKEYVVKFSTMMQFRTDDKSLQRPVKRE